MGITGLLPLLKSIQKPCQLKKFAGQTIGVDAYGWLHRGTVACAIELALGRPTRKHIDFSLHRVRMLLHFGVIPYIVFDGDYLPSKAKVEVDRAKRREESKQRGMELYRLNKPSQAHLEFQKAVDVTPEMARQFIDELKQLGVQYVVAPYEADAQLVYLEKKGIIQGMISEDSDLLVFGAKRLLTKLDQYGDCIEVNRDDFTSCRDISLVGWTDAEFRRMAILSGCDYLANVSGMGLKKAYRLVRRFKTTEKVVRMLQFEGQYHVPAGYLEAFTKAELTFMYQRVFCPLEQGVVTMSELEDGVDPDELPFIGGPIERGIALGVSRGELDPMTKAPIRVTKLSKVNDSPKTPWSRSISSIGTSLEGKENKSIQQFFKPTRTPLAELDPNSFTPSPTQRHLLQRAEGSSWNSAAVTHETPTSSTGIRRTPTEISGQRRGASWIRDTMAPLASAGLSKKRRNDSESYEEAFEKVETHQQVSSKFFAGKVSTSGGQKTKGKSRKKRATDFTVWSDDSVEDALIQMADGVSSSAQPSYESTELKREISEGSEHAPSSGLNHEGQQRPETQSSSSSRDTLGTQTSTGTIATTLTEPEESLASVLDQNVKSELASLSEKYELKAESDARSVESNTRDLRHMKNQPPIARPLTPTAPRAAATTGPSPHALNRSKSSGSMLNSRYTRPPTCPSEFAKQFSLGQATPHTQTTTALPLSYSIGPDATSLKGSEDALVPNSASEAEDGVSDSVSEVEDTPPKKSNASAVNFRQFAFTG